VRGSEGDDLLVIYRLTKGLSCCREGPEKVSTIGSIDDEAGRECSEA